MLSRTEAGRPFAVGTALALSDDGRYTPRIVVASNHHYVGRKNHRKGNAPAPDCAGPVPVLQRANPAAHPGTRSGAHDRRCDDVMGGHLNDQSERQGDIRMKTLCTTALTGALAGMVVLLVSTTIRAQTKTLEGDAVVRTVTVEAIEQSTRTLTVKGDKGIYETLQAAPDVKRFSELKVGDKITVRYYENVVVRVKKPGEAAVDVDSAALTKGQGARPAGTAATQRTITVTITEMDAKKGTVTVKGPNGYNYSRKVDDKKALSKLKVGDQLDMTWTEAMLISVDPPKK